MKDVDCNSLWIATKILLGFLGAGVISIKPCFAQSTITPDNTLGTEASQVTPNVNNPDGIKSELIEGGAQRGQNLFHSFREFNVNEGRGAYFLVPNDTIQNVLTRVTGNNPSEILGILGTTSSRNFAPTDANLFLINPNGIVFGRNASLDVNGSFVGTTANAIEFGERGFFSATNPQAPSRLLTVDPSAFLFNQINGQAVIQNNSIAPVGLKPSDDFTARGLRVSDGKSLLLVGGDINMDSGGLVALGGRVEFGGLASAGTIRLNEDGNNLGLSFPDGVERSDVFLNNGASVAVIAGDGGSIAVHTRNLEMTGGSHFFAGIDSGRGSDNSKAGNIDINATVAINLKSRSFISNQVLSGATGQGGNINISASKLIVQDGSRVDTALFGNGKGGNLYINAQDVQVTGTGLSENGLVASLLSSSAQSNSTGDAGNLTIHTNTFLVRDGATVFSSTYSTGKGGDLTIEAQDVKLIGITPDGALPSGLFSSAEQNSTGDAGNLTIHTNKLLVQDGAQVYTGTSGEGKGGDLTVDAQDVQLIGAGQSKEDQFFSGLSTETQENSKGNAGNLSMKTHTLLVRDGAKVRTETRGQGKGGILTIDAQNVQVIGIDKVSQSPSRLSTSATSTSTGDAGNLKITTRQLQVLDGADVRASTSGKGNGGNLTVDTDSLQLKNNSNITAQSEGTGTAGNIILIIKNDFNADRGQVLTQAEQSSGGDINITAGKNIFLRNNSDIKTILSTTTGSGGDITLDANVIVALEDSDILTFAPEGIGGNIRFYTFAVLSDPVFRPTSQRYDRASLDALARNNRVDVNASGRTSGGTVSGILDNSFLQNGLIQLPQNPIDTQALVASSCVVRSNKQNGTFFIVGKAGLPYRPGDAVGSIYSAVDVQPVQNDTFATKPTHRWTLGDPIVEPTQVYRLENGQQILSRECGK